MDAYIILTFKTLKDKEISIRIPKAKANMTRSDVLMAAATIKNSDVILCKDDDYILDLKSAFYYSVAEEELTLPIEA